MSYKYNLGDVLTMTNQEILDALIAKEIAPSWVVGGGYKNTRKVAIEYLTEQIEKGK